MKKILLTIDTDFVSEDVLEYTLKIFAEYKCKVNVFITSNYNCLNKYKDIVELYPHPNFDKNSTHGSSNLEVFKTISNFNCLKTGYRTHKYVESNDITELMSSNNYLFRSNICTDLTYVKPFKVRSGITEFPIYFEDGGFLKYNDFDLNLFNNINKLDFDILTFLFHPIHIAINSCNFNKSYEIKNSLHKEDYCNLSTEQLKRHRSKVGVEDLLKKLISNLDNNCTTFFSDVINLY